MRHAPATAAIVAFLALPLFSQSVDPRPRRPWVFETRNAIELHPSADIRAQLTWDEISPPALLGVVADLNRDGTDDYIIKGPPSACGTGGCPYEVFDGRTAKRIGDLFGNPIIVRAEFTRGFPNLDIYSHGSASSGSFSSYVFSGTEYVQRSVQHLENGAPFSLFRRLDTLPRWPPPCRSRDC